MRFLLKSLHFFYFSICFSCLFSQQSGIIVDLRNPEYREGVVHTQQGGVIQAAQTRIQAQSISYQHKDATTSEDTVIAEGQVRFEGQGYLFVGNRLEYNFTTQTGRIYGGKSSIYPWIFGGDWIEICGNGNYTLYNGYITSSEASDPDWKISARRVFLSSSHDLFIEQGRIRFKNFTLFYFPKFCVNLDALSDIPVKYSIRWGGRQGSRVGMIYEIAARHGLHSFLRLDYNFKRGLGAGFETHYAYPTRNESFDSINYIAKETNPLNPDIHTRYRFQGNYRRSWRQEQTLFQVSYDKLSDKEMATDYSDRGLDWKYACKTEVLVHHREKNWLGNLVIRPRINAFQTIKQELPTLSLTTLPKAFPDLGIISSLNAKASYLDFQYAHGFKNNYTATRLEVQSNVYRPLGNHFWKLTPEVTTVGIFYGNRPYHGQYWLATATTALHGKLFFSKDFETGKHLVSPYFDYRYITSPTIPPKRHYIFDITDGWYRAHPLKLGVQQYFYGWGKETQPLFEWDSYVWGLLDNPKVAKPFSRFTNTFSFSVAETLQNQILMTWDFAHGGLAELNFRSAWTVHRRFAIAGEYRQRSPYSWRKVDDENFMLDYFRSEKQLLRSPLSDNRRTLLLHLYGRLTDDVALEWQSRCGWDRKKEPSYFEFDINMHVALPAHWHMKISYQHKVIDDRFAIYFNLSPSSPKT